MKNIPVLVLLFLLPPLSTAADSGLQEPVLSEFRHAVELLDSYRGNTSALETANAGISNALKFNPRYAPAHKEMARYLLLSGHIHSYKFRPGSLEAADASLAKAVDIDPNYADAYVLRGQIYRYMGRRKEAFTALQKAESLGVTSPSFQNSWADLLMDERNFQEAAKRYRAVIDSGTSNKRSLMAALEGLIICYTETGKLDQADGMYKRQLALEPDSAWSYGNYARFLLCNRDDYEGAIAQSRHALSIMDYSVGRFWLGAGLYRKWAEEVTAGTRENGKASLSEARTIYPDANGITYYANSCPPLQKIVVAFSLTGEEANSGKGNLLERFGSWVACLLRLKCS